METHTHTEAPAFRPIVPSSQLARLSQLLRLCLRPTAVASASPPSPPPPPLPSSLLLSFFFFLPRRCLYSTKNVPDVGQPTPASHPQFLKEGEITPGITSEEYILRRKRLLEILPDKSLAIVAAAPVKMMTDVVPYTYRPDADYLYITGCQQPGGVAVLGHEFGLCMFMPETRPHDVIWQGQIAGVDAALDTFKAEQSYPMNKLHEILPDMIRSSSKLFHNKQTALPTYMDLEAFQKAASIGIVKDLSVYTHEARLIKSPAELGLMRDSASIACQALLQTMLHSKTFPCEARLSAKVEYECKMRGAQRMAFNPVVGGGPNGSVIHYSRNDQKVQDGDLVLMDIGCELHGYVSDLTRTWPPCGRCYEEWTETCLTFGIFAQSNWS
ncbi:hypothetical protein TEA_009920 [Camellia sinensis var. sinensis]|uniref:Aminopeptidase P N-terminal domain-containing protein n=1 Tax=Camellia sinensis var. sinensis TaxID=542762 RepID=A0A4S4D319_CAMSN|nr:hypothetical protein TEA_009920 [Camellia sinensis var. sinensis]